MNTVELDAGLDDEHRRLLGEVLQAYESNAALPEAQPFRIAHHTDRGRIDLLQQERLLELVPPRYYLTVRGLLACGSTEAKTAHHRCAELLTELKSAYLAVPQKPWDVRSFGERVGRSAQEVARLVTLLKDLPGILPTFNGSTGFTATFSLLEPILDAKLPDWPEESAAPGQQEEVSREAWIERVEISGYRPFLGLSAELARLTVIIGANASGKSSLFDVLRLLGFAAEHPLPPEIDPRNTAVSSLFHAGGPDRIDLALTAGFGPNQSLRYEASIHRPAGTPRVARERLVAASRLPEGATAPFVFLELNGGRGTARDPRERALPREWSAPPNELALRSVRDPRLETISRFQRFVASWQFYSGFDVSPEAAVRRPAPIEESPILAENGSNLTAVLNSLVLEHHEAREELETYLRAVIPTFESLNVRPRGGRGMAIGVIRERGVGELTLGDLSDGTLRLLCWLALALSPALSPLVCIDEPEIGVHPRALPVLAGALKLASARAQILIATHSPHFLSQFTLDDIAVMRKEDGRATFVRPATSDALRAMVAEMGGDALARLFLSEELEVLS